MEIMCEEERGQGIRCGANLGLRNYFWGVGIFTLNREPHIWGVQFWGGQAAHFRPKAVFSFPRMFFQRRNLEFCVRTMIVGPDSGKRCEDQCRKT